LKLCLNFHQEELMEPQAQLKTVLERAGGPAELARKLSISTAAVSQWAQVPAKRVGAVSEITGLSPHEIRPDLFRAPETRQ